MERLIVWHRWVPPPESSPEAVAQASLWRIATRDRFVRAGAELVSELGGTAVLSLDPSDVSRAVELCLDLVEASERDEPEHGGICFALTLGAVERAHAQGTYVGDAIDRAQALANHVTRSDIVLDELAQAAASSAFLFAREVQAGGGIKGELLDRTFPRRAQCSANLAHLDRPHVPPTAHAQLGALHKLSHASGRHRVLLVGSFGSGASAWIDYVAEDLAPTAWLDLRALSTALAPLSGLTYALRRVAPEAALERVLDGPDEPDRQSLTTLRAVREGRAVARREVIMALRQYLGRWHERSGKRALVTVNPAPMVDPASVGVIAEASREGSPDALVIMRLPLDTKPPEAFARGGGLAEIRVPSLSQQEARALAQSMLGKDTPHDIARRAAAMGGTTPLGVAEAVRVLIASGDVVFDGVSFRWRRGPAGRVSTLSLEALLEERVDQLGADARRMLEALVCVPDPDETALVEAVASADGLSAERRASALEELVAAAVVERREHSLVVAPTLRAVVEASVPPARLAELHRFAATAIEPTLPADDPFARAMLAYYLARGGRPRNAVGLLLESAVASGQFGFVRSGVRLAAAAVECDPSDETRDKAANIAEQLSARANARRLGRSDRPSVELPSDPPPAQPIPSARPLATQAQQQAVEAILARDFDAVERALELVVAAGKDGPSVDRLRAITRLVKGDRAGALRLLHRARHRERDAGLESPRTALASALVFVETGELGLAVRECLRALARSREQGDIQGERAALMMLSACYRRLGRETESQELARAAGSASLPAPPAGGSSGP